MLHCSILHYADFKCTYNTFLRTSHLQSVPRIKSETGMEGRGRGTYIRYATLIPLSYWSLSGGLCVTVCVAFACVCHCMAVLLVCVMWCLCCVCVSCVCVICVCHVCVMCVCHMCVMCVCHMCVMWCLCCVSCVCVMCYAAVRELHSSDVILYTCVLCFVLSLASMLTLSLSLSLTLSLSLPPSLSLSNTQTHTHTGLFRGCRGV
jgi:hypothetical protein